VSTLADPRIRYFCRTESTGGRPAKIRNEAARSLVSGEYLYFLDDDDTIDADTLVAMVQALDQSSKSMAIASVEPWGPQDSTVVKNERRHFCGSRSFLRRTRSRIMMLAGLLFGAPVLTCGACVVRRSTFLGLGGFNENLPLFEDLEFYIRAIRREGFVFVDDVLLRRRTGLPSLINNNLNNGELISSSYKMIHGSYKEIQGMMEYYILRLVAAVARRRRPFWPAID